MADPVVRLPADHAVRVAVASDLDHTLFVEAGAGSGKTTVLVDRVCSLIEAGVDVRAIAAITFTEKAASELRVRVREKLVGQPRTPAIEAALASLGEAPMSTLHAFARRLLTEHGLAVGVPPRFDVLDTVAEAIYLEERWRELAVELFEDPGPLTEVIARAVELGLKPKGVHEIVLALHQSHDRLRGRGVEWPAATVTLPPIDLTPIIDAIDASPIADLPEVVEYAQRAREAKSDGECIDILRVEGVLPRQGPMAGRVPAKVATEVATALRREALDALLPALQARVLRWADERVAEGRLLFHDLLVLARDALRDPDVRAAARARYQRILIDEFQDTDPLQIEIAVLLASSRDDIGAREWSADPLEPADAGRLFFVGDPKQSIYRFRRADIDLYQTAQRVFADEPLRLTENFRTVQSIVEFVNALFGAWMGDPDAVGQPAYTPLTAHVDDHDDAPSVVFIGDETDAPAGEIRLQEADAVVRVIAQAKREGWMVRDPDTKALRPAAYGDIAVLMPTRATLPALDYGLDAAGIPLRVESRILIWNTLEVRDLLAVLSAIADPNDQVAIVAALRSAGLGCSDRDLATWKWSERRWRYRDIRFAPDEAQAHPVGRALLVLSELHDTRHWLSIGEMARRVVEVCHLRELAFAHVRPRDRWRRIDFFLAQARAFEEAGGSSIEQFVTWARDQAERDVWENDSVEPDPDDDAVRVLTVHASKGLEFPIVVLMGTSAAPRTAGPPVIWADDGGIDAKAGPKEGDRFETAGYADAWEHEKQLLASERARLGYVAMTRARDHLVVSRFRSPSRDCMAKDMTRFLPELPTIDPEPLPDRVEPEREAFDHEPLSAREAFIEHRATLVAGALVPRAIAATGLKSLVPVLEADDPSDDDAVERPSSAEADDRPDDEPPWRRGRAGTAIGRAVHAVLQTIDLATGDGAAALAVAQASAEGVPDLAEQIERRVRAVLESPSVKAAVATGRYWREVFVAVPVGDRVLEGFIDLLYEDADGNLVVVDYKTDGVRVDADADEAVGRYRLQAAAYALAVSRSLSRPVDRCVFVFANPSRWFERELDDLEIARAEVEALLV